ncbi:hypothetical protein D1610_05105 [Sphingomonas gilva]|uniref:Nuclear transport factor 2 family protein n=1 Tax=Sphingomonas gilva TaxID=2305907 RepID=A0A396RRF7_9SPHN|nr:hypothetical protein [Sphingomonas gilva]RHW17892.1 hypothetical protein D1610_05105 [Sphingomonas gilva]
MTLNSILRNGPGRLIAPALLILGAAGPAPAQQQTSAPASNVPVPGELELSKLIWSTMAAVDHANQAGNYSVLRDLSAPGFQVNNDAARLAQVFASLRAQNIDLSNCLLLAPTYTSTPTQVQPGVLRVQGYFGLRPTAIVFDLYYQWAGGKWRLFGVSITPRRLAGEQPRATPSAVPTQAPAPQRR